MPWHRALILLLAAAACGAPAIDFEIGGPAPAFELPLLDGGTIHSGDLAGRPLVINFWATWCQPCRREIPELASLAESGEARILGIALDEAATEHVAAFAERHSIPYEVALGDQDVFRRFDGFTVPYTVVVDAAWRVAAVHRGPTSAETLRRDLGE